MLSFVEGQWTVAVSDDVINVGSRDCLINSLQLYCLHMEKIFIK